MKPNSATAAERELARLLRSVLADTQVGDRIPESKLLLEAMSCLEYFIPQILREIHTEWKNESLDAVFPESVVKLSEHEIELWGTCIIISDQTMVPTHTRIRVSAEENLIEFMDCKLGELVGPSMKRVPYGGNCGCRLAVAWRMDKLKWAYHVAFGPPANADDAK